MGRDKERTWLVQGIIDVLRAQYIHIFSYLKPRNRNAPTGKGSGAPVGTEYYRLIGKIIVIDNYGAPLTFPASRSLGK